MVDRRKLPPDTRLDWRDPAMPVLRDYTFQSGQIRTIIDPEWEVRWRQHCMKISTSPDWKSDPTYNMRKPRPR